jgi:ribonuclease D
MKILVDGSDDRMRLGNDLEIYHDEELAIFKNAKMEFGKWKERPWTQV